MNEMSFLTEDHLRFRDNLRRFIDTEVVPKADAWEETGMVPREVLRQLGELGYLGIRYPATYGGAELDTVYSAILAEELGRSSYGGFAVTVLVHTDMASPHLGNFGSPEQLARWMPGIIAGTTICAVAVTEPDAGSDVAGIKTRAVRDGDHYVLTGSKMFITNGVHGDLYFVAAKTDTTVKGSRGISIFAVEKGTPGFEIGHPGPKMGGRGVAEVELFFDHCRVPVENLIMAGDPNSTRSFKRLMSSFGPERVGNAAMCLGVAQGAYELARSYSLERKQFGKPICEFQGIQWKVADMATQIHAARLMIYRAATNLVDGFPDPLEAAYAKLYANEMVQRVTNEALQIHGHYGFTREFPLERMVRDSRGFSLGGGTTEILRNTIAAIVYGRAFDQRKG